MRQKEKLDKINKIIWWYENENMQAVHRVRKYQLEMSRYHH